MRPQEIIARKRDGNSLSDAEIGVFIDGVCTEAWADYQISALVMAMFINGLDQREQDELTRAMVYSGKVLDLASVDRPVVDKHSTGGVGDKTSLIIAPVAAACGLAVPMISGRGLGHTGGTLDKLESIEGFDVGLSMTRFTELLATNGYAMAGQTGEIAPADKKLYALRDATATVPYIPLIVASIMSKKLAEDLDALVLDVKTGSGAFMQKYEDSVRLAEALVQTGKAFGVNTQAVVSDMSQPLGKFVGNALEVYECIKLLRGEGDDAMSATLVLSVELTARMLLLGGIADSMSSAETMINEALASGKALAKFRENVEVQGGDPSVCDDPESLIDPTLKRIPFGAATSGYVAEVNTFAVGRAICDIGGGRIKAEDGVDHAVGLECTVKIGNKVEIGDPLGIIYCRTQNQADSISEILQSAYKITEEIPDIPKLIRATV
ncbi:MAG TPA: thymidine phosphorylase [Pyrinomonadaceae bacterium]|nr:thymidine phosphorylase [Chloracidobacterium sp.]MBP9935810.1 thymidine phosphorylase [Pyrinomonadaceae bacterium]MBK7803025.1 thymidine phosphorylase [Chloracidobacterium sp.]MBK9438325.1 thymidine phosphorylase [Chloracidobacterium sp.]MBL0240790.1 thymidine phosphorylase [Chloracidobacterium sp.]